MNQFTSKGHYGWIFTLLYFIPTHACHAQDYPTYQDAVAAYRQNIQSGLPMSVEWLVTEYELPASIEWTAANIALLQRMIASPEVDAKIKESLKVKLDIQQESLTEDARKVRLNHSVRRHFLWTDGKQIHYRFSNDPEFELDKDFGSALSKDFGDRPIYTYDPDRVPKLRVWQGYAADGETLTGLIGTKEIGQFINRSYLPPLGYINDQWVRSQQFSCLDRWTNNEAGLQPSEMGPVIDGDQTLLIQNIHGDDADKSTSVGRLSVWSVSDRGFIPKKVEYAYSGGLTQIATSDEYPLRILETVEVGEIVENSGMFYPKRVKWTKYDIEPNWYREHLSDVDLRKAVPRVPFSVRIEEILSVKPHREIPENWMEIPFPDGTRYMDMDTKHFYMEGVPKEEFDRQLVAELTEGTGVDRNRVSLEAPSDWFNSGFIIAINIGVLLILALMYLYTRRRM